MTQTLHIFYASADEPVIAQIARAMAPAEVATRIKSELTSRGYRGGLVLLGIPSAWCLAASVPCGDIHSHDRKTLLYRFEEVIPLPAEDVIADFVRMGDRALGVCVRVEPLRGIVESLEAENVPVQAICATALLAAQSTGERDGLMLLREDDQTNIVWLRGGQLIGWSLVPATGDDLRLQCGVASLDFDSPPESRTIENISEPAAQIATEIISGKAGPWIELRRGPLGVRDRLRAYRKPLNAALAAAAVLLIAIAGCLLLNAQRYAAQERDDRRELAAAFAREFPGWAIPANITTVIQSEHRKIGGRTSGALPAEFTDSALRTMHAVLGKLPVDVRYNLDRMSFSDSAFELQGRLKSYEDADKLAAVARSSGLIVVPPQVRRDAEGFWSFTLRAEKPGGSAPVLAKQD